MPFIEHAEKGRNVLRVDEALREFEQPLAGFGVDVNVGNEVVIQLLCMKGAHHGVELVDALLVVGFLFGRELGRRLGGPASAASGSGGLLCHGCGQGEDDDR